MEYPFWVIYESECCPTEVWGEFSTYEEASAYLSEQDSVYLKELTIYAMQPLKRGATE